MEKLEFKIEIDAPAKRVWFSLWDDFFYRDWTRVFCEGSYMLTNWELRLLILAYSYWRDTRISRIAIR